MPENLALSKQTVNMPSSTLYSLSSSRFSSSLYSLFFLDLLFLPFLFVSFFSFFFFLSSSQPVNPGTVTDTTTSATPEAPGIGVFGAI